MPQTNSSNLLRLAELPRAGIEIASLVASSPLLGLSPRGERHPVVVIPGFLADDDSTRVLRQFLRYLGYSVYPWGQGRNLGAARMGGYEPLIDHVIRIHRRAGQKVSLVGWSLGGVHAVAVADRAGHAVRQLVALGSPITNPSADPAMLNSLRATAQQLHGEVITTPQVYPRSWHDTLMALNPELPVTAIYSRTDGVVPWQRSHIDTAGSRDNIEVHSSHIGLGFNPAVLYAVADRLAQKTDAFSKFHRRGWRALTYPAPQAAR